MAWVVALLGAESTGKTTLALDIGVALRAEGRSVAVVSEYLREFCDTHGRTPFVHEQAHIADEQTRRIEAAASNHDVVVADTSALMVAVYSELVFGDPSLYDAALNATRRCGLLLLTALDLPWAEDGLLRDGPHVRQPVDALLRSALARGGLGYSVVSGQGEARTASALSAVRHALNASTESDEARANPRWQWLCDRCGDVACERHLLPRR